MGLADCRAGPYITTIDLSQNASLVLAPLRGHLPCHVLARESASGSCLQDGDSFGDTAAVDSAYLVYSQH